FPSDGSLVGLENLQKSFLLLISFKSLAIMTGNLLSPSKNAYSRWGGSSLSLTSGGSSTKDSTVLSSQSLSSFLTPGRNIVLDLGGGVVVHCSKLLLEAGCPPQDPDKLDQI
ncbi:hypothetical protein Tco_0254075, partial [Tanacetum coccineum]